MNAYILIIIADIFLAANIVFQKIYQKTAGTSVKAGLLYNAATGVFSALLFLIMNQFQIKLTGFSVLMAAIFAVVFMLYIFIGFKIMEKKNMALYTLFLMSGGMTVPYVFGVLFLNEELTVIRTIGLLAIIISIAVSNSGAEKPDKKQLLLCLAVFFLNGVSSVTSKIHQISPASEIVKSTDFAFLVMLFKAVICSVVMFICKNKFFGERSVKLPVKSVIGFIVLASLADGLTYMLQLIGATKLPATVLYPFVTGGSVIFTSLAGVIVFREKLSQRQLIAIAVCFVATLMFL